MSNGNNEIKLAAFVASQSSMKSLITKLNDSTKEYLLLDGSEEAFKHIKLYSYLMILKDATAGMNPIEAMNFIDQKMNNNDLFTVMQN